MWQILKASATKSATYWEGWQAVSLNRQCTYTDPKERKEWAKGFADGVDEMRGSKVWWKSRTLIIGVGMLVFGVGLGIYGMYGQSPNAPTIMGAGMGMSASSIVMSALRLITSNNTLALTAGQYTPPPPQ